MNIKTWLWLTPVVTILIAVSIWIGWTLLNSMNNIESNIADDGNAPVTEGREDISTEVVNTPVEESIIVFKNDVTGYSSGHDFIRKLHYFYNETLTWGRINTASYQQQKEKAAEIMSVIENIEITDQDLLADFQSIKNLAETVTKEDNRDAMRKLHRYFHDLDIILNGYNYNQTFQVTAFRGY